LDEERLSAWERLEPVRLWTRRIERDLDLEELQGEA
jgi:hypothetical protein